MSATGQAEAPAGRIWRRAIDTAACATLGGALAAVLATTADMLARTIWDQVSPLRHFGAVFGLFVVVGVLLGAGFALSASLASALYALRPGRRWRLLVGLTLCAVAGVLAPRLTADAIYASLSGVFERAPAEAATLERWAHIAVGGGAAILVGLCQLSLSAASRKQLTLPLLVSSPMLLLAAALVWADLNLLVALYAKAHEVAELAAWVIASAALSILSYALVVRSARARRVVIGIAALAGVWTLAVVTLAPARAALDARLTHVWREPAYAARMALRLQLAEDYLRDPTAWKGRQDSRLGRLIDRYDIATVDLSPRWDLPQARHATPPVTERPFNVVVVFVDTLRADVAADRALMPKLNDLRAESLDFARAYAAASDTVSVLPVLTGGCYQQAPCPADVLRLTSERGIRSGLVAARSANRFLKKLTPHFAFDDVIDIPDYEEGREVWGYGADRPTAAQVTRDALAWIDSHRDQPFLVWALHFDVHNWMHLDESYLASLADAHGIARLEDNRNWKYFAASAGVDDAIGALVAGLRSRGLDDTTAILVVSDHGEALGMRGHAYHAVHLWQPLIHVPLILRVPNMAPRRVDWVVGHADVAPTLAQLFQPDADLAPYHGASLLGRADDEARKLPLLLYAMRKEELLRLAVIDRAAPRYKLELPLDSVEPELYDLDRPDPDDTDLRQEQHTRALKLLSELVTSPIFPRPEPKEGEAPGQGRAPLTMR